MHIKPSAEQSLLDPFALNRHSGSCPETADPEHGVQRGAAEFLVCSVDSIQYPAQLPETTAQVCTQTHTDKLARTFVQKALCGLCAGAGSTAQGQT